VHCADHSSSVHCVGVMVKDRCTRPDMCRFWGGGVDGEGGREGIVEDRIRVVRRSLLINPCFTHIDHNSYQGCGSDPVLVMLDVS